MSAFSLRNSEGDDSDNSDIDDVLKTKLADLEKEVKALHLQKDELEHLVQQPVEFKCAAGKKHLARTESSQKHLLQLENKFLLKKLMFHRLSGVVTAKREGKEIILQFNASVRGRYFEPGYVHFRRLAGGSWSVVRYFLHDAVNVREMAKTYPLTDEEEFIHFVQSVQLCVEAYNDRKCQITRAKEVAQSKELNLFSSIDCMFVMLTVKESNKRSFPVTISLIYEPSGVRPVSLEAQSKGADKKILSKAAEEFEIFKKLSLDEGLAILFLKEEQSNGSPSPEGSSMFHVLEEADHEDERRGSAMRLDSVELTSESDSSDVGSAKVKRKGISLGSRKGVNRPRNHAGSRLVRVSRGSSRGNTGRNANRSVRRDVATSLRSRGRNMKKRR